MATTARTRMTVEEFIAATEADPRSSELIDGEIVVTEVAFPHGRLQAALIVELGLWRRRASGRVSISGPTEVRLTDHDAYGPDLVVCRPTAQAQRSRPARRAAADLRRDPLAEHMALRRRAQEVRLRGAGRSRAVARRRRRARACSCSAARRPLSTTTTPRWSSTSRTRSPRRCCPASSSRCPSCSSA